MSRAFRWIMLAVAMGGPAFAQTEPPPMPEANKSPLAAFSQAFSMARRLYIDPLPAKTLITRATQGLATAPTLASPEQKRLVAAALGQMGAAAADDVLPLLRGFGNLLDALHATAGSPALDGMLRAAIAGMLDGLDPQTRFVPPATAASATGEASAGLKLAASPDGPLVLQAFSQGPAAKAGVQQGDDLVAIDGHATRGLSMEDVAALLRGPVGSSATLLILRDAASAPITVAVTRAMVRPPLVSGRLIGSVAYLRLEAFAPGAAQVLRREFAALQSRAAPLSGVVLDLRDNAGGRLAEAVATADEFLPPATLIATTTGREAAGNQRFTAAAGDMTGGLPLIVLVNEATSAGSEIVAEALQQGRGAVVMGSHTAGAGLVTTVMPLPPLGAMNLTTQRIILASGAPLKSPGVLPQVALVSRKTVGPGSSTLEAPSSDPMIVRLRRGIPQTPQAGEPFDAPDAPEPDFEMRQACAALAILSPGIPPH